jgi:7-cyano-7-deazaguanine synthase
MAEKKVSLLLSGGIDSTTTLSYYKENGYQVETYFVNYGHVANNVEFEHAETISKYYDTRLNVLKFSGAAYGESLEITGRNAFLIISVLMANQSNSRIISAGIHKGSDYYDCNEGFIMSMKSLIDGYTNGSVQLDLPLIKMTKTEIVAYCKLHEVPIEQTFSCQLGGNMPCGNCPSCIERNYALKSAVYTGGGE